MSKPILSGHCASAEQTPNPRAAHERCKLDGCPCPCGHVPDPPAPRVKVSLRCLTGDHDACPGHPDNPLSVIRTPCGCIHAAHTDDLVPAGVQLSLTEEGRQLASQRDDLVAAGVDPADLVVPLAPPDAVADGFAWPNLPYDGPLTTHDRQRIAAAWLAYDLPGAYAVVETILREHGAGS